MWALEFTQDFWAALTSRGTNKEVVTEAPGAMGSPAREQTVSVRMRLAGLLSGGTSTSCKANRAARGKSKVVKPKGRQEGLLKKDEGLLATVRTKRKRPEQHPVE